MIFCVKYKITLRVRAFLWKNHPQGNFNILAKEYNGHRCKDIGFKIIRRN